MITHKNGFNMKYVVFDIETTGLDINNDYIIELGAVKVENGIVIDEFSTLINPGILIPEEVSSINNITNDMIIDAPFPGVALTHFKQFISDANFLVGHNAKRFDMPFLLSEFKRHAIYINEINVVDTLWEARKVLKGLGSYSLASLCNALGIENKRAHRALSDVYATHQLYLHILSRKK